MYMKTIKKWGSMLLSAIMLMSLLAIPGVLAEEAPVQITGLDQLQTIESGSYQLAADLTIPENAILTVPSDVTITLDLNGHTVSKPTGTGRILNNMGTMTINDSSEGKTGLVTAYRNTIGNFGTMVINGGTFETHCNVGGTAVMNEEGGTMTVNQIVVNADFFAVNNEGDMVINGGEFHSTSSNEPGTFAYCVRNFANMTIYDATITGIQGALASASGVLKVYDGNFSTAWDNSRSFYALYIAGEVDVVTGFVYGGTFSSPKYAIYIGNDNKGGDGGINADATTYVYGGTYYGGKSAIYRAQETGNPYVTGGTYRIGQSPDDTPDPVVKNYMAEGCVYNETTGQVTDPRVFSVTIDEAPVSLIEGGTAELKTTVEAGADADKTVTYTSSDTDVATVAADGTLTAVAPGKADITAAVGDKSDTCTVVVVGKPVVPTVDPEKPVDKVEVGVSEEGVDVVGKTVNQVVDQILSDADVGGAVTDETKEAVKTAVKQDKPIAVEIKTETLASEAVNPADAEKTADAAGEKAEIAQYLDLSVLLKADGETIGTLNKLVQPIQVQIAIPADLLAEGRTFYVIRVHDGVAEKLDTTVQDGVAVFETDRFSTYALVYEDAAVSGGSSQVSTPETPVTGRGDFWPFCLALLLGVSALAVVAVCRRRPKAAHIKRI